MQGKQYPCPRVCTIEDKNIKELQEKPEVKNGLRVDPQDKYAHSFNVLAKKVETDQINIAELPEVTNVIKHIERLSCQTSAETILDLTILMLLQTIIEEKKIQEEAAYFLQQANTKRKRRKPA